MEKILVKSGQKLSGQVDISAAKNSVLPIIAASILSDEKVIIKNYPSLNDVRVLTEVLYDIGCDISMDEINYDLQIDPTNIKKYTANCELVKKMRASFLVMGPMLAKYKKFTLSCPGGCNIGTRPIDLHLKGFEALGAKIVQEHGFIEIIGENLKGNEIYLDFPSVGATENIMMAASRIEGRTVINNPALEPEIEDLANFLNSMGAKVQFNINSTIIIDGVKSLKGTTYQPIYDRIEAGTFMVAAAITNSTIQINGVEEEHLKPVIQKLIESGSEITIDSKTKIAIVKGPKEIIPTDIITRPHPGYPTDMQSQMMSLLAIANGNCNIEETVFENRFMNVAELSRMGADIKIKGNTSIITGVKKLTGCQVKASDLRSGAALILAGLVAEGYTEIEDIYHIDRGYMNIEDKFSKLGAQIYRVK
ncbi:UDP-N-acetylglucosamine 1-carboxyvinyltransferase [uncultured Clostridium sp.]|uniref:UDP-N-acetylglucosamine 1-carboxyvinyltransferase n=1 Tax=uncultured Clostridium sp. TaxID=59620 RepID=UPI0026174858|nr:UDP-N-acetylglucosamine 1-carboxyvinyltransferase [uncultured Clostridium sp.]